MKKLLIMMGLFTIASAKAQPFLSVKGTTKGAGLSIGWLDNHSGIEMNAGYILPLLRTDQPTIFHISAGKRILLSHNAQDNFSITPSIGYADYSVKDFSAYDRDKFYGEIISIKESRLIYGLEAGKDWHLGRLFISMNYCKKAFYGIGIRAFLK